MESNQTLISKFRENGVNLDELIGHINEEYGCLPTVIYGSFLDGLGNKFSDIDVYVISDIDQERCIKRTFINNMDLDLEILSQSKLSTTLDRIDNISGRFPIETVSAEDLKILYRMAVGLQLNCNFALERARQKRQCIISSMTMLRLAESTAQFSDAANLLESGDAESSIITARHALEFSAAALAIAKGYPVLNLKWVHRALGFDPELQHEFGVLMGLCVVNPLNPFELAEEILRVSNNWCAQVKEHLLT